MSGASKTQRRRRSSSSSNERSQIAGARALAALGLVWIKEKNVNCAQKRLGLVSAFPPIGSAGNSGACMTERSISLAAVQHPVKLYSLLLLQMVRLPT